MGRYKIVYDLENCIGVFSCVAAHEKRWAMGKEEHEGKAELIGGTEDQKTGYFEAEFDEDELDKFTEQLSTILDYISKLDELNTENIEPTSHVIDLKNCFKEDEARESLSAEASLRNAPMMEKNFFKVPKIIE